VRRWCKRVGIALLASGLACIVVYSYALFNTAGKLRRAAKDVSKPDVIARHDALVAAQKSVVADGQPSVALAEELGRIAEFEAFFEHIDGLSAMKSVYDFRRLLYDRPYRSLTADTKDEVQAALASVQPEVERLCEMAAAGGPLAALDFSTGLRLDYPYLYDVRACAALLDADLIVRLNSGDFTGATADLAAFLQLAAILAREPHVMAQVTRYYDFYQRLFDTMQRHCSLDDLSQDDLVKLINMLDGAVDHESLSEALQSEQYLGYYGFDQLARSGWSGRTEFLDRLYRNERDSLWVFSHVYLFPVFRPHHNSDMAAHLRLLGLATDAAAEPYFISKAKWDDIEQRYNAAPMGFLRLAYAQRVINLGGFQANCETEIHLLQIAMGLSLYHRGHGAYPAELAELSVTFPDGLPVDPFTGEAYRYERVGESAYLLYGVGWNLKDDGGTQKDNLDVLWRGGEQSVGTSGG
jgi:hypothetical protein